MPQVDWSYHRNGCKTCARATGFLSDHDVEIAQQEDARKLPLVEKDALELVSDANELYVTRGTKVIHINLRTDRPDDETLLGLLIGPSGKLRAPTIKIGRTVIVGFDQTTYENVFCVPPS